MNSQQSSSSSSPSSSLFSRKKIVTNATSKKKLKIQKGKKNLSKTSCIAIIGGGIGGLSTALSLQRAGFSNVHVFERYTEPIKQISKEILEESNPNKHGYGLTLTYNPKGPLAKLGILEELALRDTPSRSHYVFSSNGCIMGYFGNAFIPNRGHGQRGNLRVPRYTLREVMLEQIHRNNENVLGNDEGYDNNEHKTNHFEDEKKDNSKKNKKKSVTFHWAKKLLRFEYSSLNSNNEKDNVTNERSEDKKFTLWFEDGYVFPNVDLLIGADGIRSVVRTLILSNNQISQSSNISSTIHPQSALQYIKIFLILGISDLDHPLLTERGFYTLDGTNRLFTMPYQDDDFFNDFTNNSQQQQQHKRRKKRIKKTMWQLSFHMENEKEAMILAKSNANHLLEEVKKRVENWHEPVLDMIISTNLSSVWGTALMDQPNAIYLHSKSQNSSSPPPPYILIGDAVHPMSPFKGQGANQALTDGPALTDWLLKSKLSSALLGFEREMHSRSRPKVLASHVAAKKLHSPEVMLTTTTATNNDAAIETTIAGVKQDSVGRVIKALQDFEIRASAGADLDKKVRAVIDSLSAGIEINDHSNNAKDNICFESSSQNQEMRQVTAMNQALIYARAGETSNLRNLSLEYSCVTIQQAKEDNTGRSCLFLAALGGYFHTTKWLLKEAGVLDYVANVINDDVNASKIENKKGLVDNYEFDKKCVSLSYEKVVDFSKQNPLHAAVIGRNPKVISIILSEYLKKGWNGWENNVDQNGDSAIMLIKKVTEDENEQLRLLRAFQLDDNDSVNS